MRTKMQNHVFRRENSQMLKAIKIEGLFSRFDYDIEMKEEGITILTGPNGFGKSTIFSLIEAVAAADADAIRRTSFKKTVLFCEGKNVTIEKSGKQLFVDGEAFEDGGKRNLEADKTLPGAVKSVGGRKLLDSALNDWEKLKDYIEDVKSVPKRLKARMESGGQPAADRTKLFIDLIKDKLNFKTPVADAAEGLKFVDADGVTLGFTELSAGEAQLTAFYYELLFETPEKALILIDEPEISMHIVWQMRLVDDLERICAALNGAKAIVATHSPQILGGHRSLQVDLGEQYEC